jgi:Leucine-rich repeat (LRR) protein
MIYNLLSALLILFLLTELCKLNKLEELDLHGNLFEGILPPCLNNMASFKFLDISRNQFVGNISSNLIAIPTSIRYIDLSYNLFKGLFSFSLFANHSKLEAIILVSENSKIEIETEDSSGCDDLSFQLKVIELRHCTTTKGNVPKFLFDQRELEIVDLSHNKLKGSFPNWLLENNIGLQLLYLRNNSFVGKIHLPPNHYKSILFMDVSENCFDGQLQENIGKIITYLQYLNLFQNLIEGYLPSSIGDMRYLEVLNLSFNNFSGELPTELFATCTSLSVLNLCSNQFTCTIPGCIGNMTNLSSFVISNNSFEGQIPCGLDSIAILDLSHNSLSGLLPPCLNLRFVLHLHLQGNKLTGPIPKAILNSSSLCTLDLRDNSFFGSIPDEISVLSNLKILLLRGNYFSDTIPNQLCWLNNIGIIDLSNNSLSGTIPHCFHNMSFGNILDDFASFEYVDMYSPIRVDSTFQTLLKRNSYGFEIDMEYEEQVEVE